jgi:NAD(P)-dependent dehydrogenase (short-subunit alcohol dehydrogenase family)
MRERRWGRVVFLGSLMADFPVPFQGGYAATKLALRGVVTALRAEVEPHGVRVCLVQPGYYGSAIDRQRTWHTVPDSPYATRVGRVADRVHRFHQRAGDPAEVAAHIWRLAGSARPPLVSAVGSHGPTFRLIRRMLPDRVAERLVTRRYGI